MSPGRRRSATIALLVAVGAALHAPSLALRPFHGEESRRAIPAREMLRSGDWVLPTIWGNAYLNKPPGHFWLVAGASRLRGEVDEWSTRVPSVVSTLATAVLVTLWGAALFGEMAGALGGVFFLLSLNVLGKGQVGEIEPPLALAVLGSLVLLWEGREGRWGALLGAGACLGIALLLKGPPGLLFYGAAGIGIAVAGAGPRFLVSMRFWVPIGIALIPVLAWAGALLASADADQALHTWWIEASRTGGKSNPARFWSDRPRFLLGALGAYVPSVLVIVASVRTPTGRGLLADGRIRFLLVTLAASFAYFLVTPGPRPRYVYPLVAFSALLAAVTVARAFQHGDTALQQRIRWLTAVGLVAALGAGLAGFAPLLRPVAGLDGLSFVGILLLLATVAVAALGLRAVRGSSLPRAVGFALAGLALLRIFQVAEMRSQLYAERDIVERMHVLESTVPAGEALGIHVDAMWNELIYLEHPVVWVEEPEQAAPGSFLLLDGRARERFEGARELAVLGEALIRGHRHLSVLRVVK